MTQTISERDEFVAVLARELPDMAAHHVAELAGFLVAASRKMDRLAVALCNGDIDQEPFSKRADRLREKIDAKFAEFGKLEYLKDKMPAIQFQLGGDPRGYTLKLHLPSKRHNTWGGEEAGYGVPTK